MTEQVNSPTKKCHGCGVVDKLNRKNLCVYCAERKCDNCSLEHKYGKPFRKTIDEDGYEVTLCRYCYASAKVVSIC